ARLIVELSADGTGHPPPAPKLYAGNLTFGALSGQTLTVDSTSGLLSEAFDGTGKSVKVTAVNGRAANVGSTIVLPSGATLTVRADGLFVYVRRGNSQYSDSFTFTVGDGAHSASATVTVNGFTPWMYVSDAAFVTAAGKTLTVPAAVGL